LFQTTHNERSWTWMFGKHSWISTVLAVTPRELCVLSDSYAKGGSEYHFFSSDAYTSPPQN
jgi:hypothetical protein